MSRSFLFRQPSTPTGDKKARLGNWRWSGTPFYLRTGKADGSFRRGGPAMQSIALPQPLHKLLLTVHVGASVSVLGADLVLLALGIASLTGADPLTI
jgi:hypothetical protein